MSRTYLDGSCVLGADRFKLGEQNASCFEWSLMSVPFELKGLGQREESPGFGQER